MRILIATGIYPPEVGGIATYATGLEDGFASLGHETRILTYGRLERLLPVGLRHLLVFLRAIPKVLGADLVLVLDTISTGLPTALAARMCRRPVYARIGGDFLWESFVERTGRVVTLPDFYAHTKEFTLKERAILKLQGMLLSIVTRVVFTTRWQRDIWSGPYGIPKERISVIENALDLDVGDVQSPVGIDKCFLWAGRPIALKNLPLLSQVFEEDQVRAQDARLECVTGAPHEELMRRVRDSYALILPSFSDVSPNFILEGLRHGRPFIMTKHTGLGERLRGAGFYVDPTDKEDIARAVVALCDERTYGECVSVLKEFSYRHSYADIAGEFLALHGRE